MECILLGTLCFSLLPIIYLILKLLSNNYGTSDVPKELHVCPFLSKWSRIDEIENVLSTVLFTESKWSLSRAHVKLALNLLWRRQPMMRMKFKITDGCDIEDVKYFEEVQVENGKEKIDFMETDALVNDWKTVMEEELLQTFDIFSNKPLWRVRILKESFDAETKLYRNAVFFVFHHTIADGISIVKLYDQFLEYLHLLQESQDVEVESLPLLPSSYQLAEKEIQLSFADYVLEAKNFILQWCKYKMIEYGFWSLPINQFLQVFPPVALEDEKVVAKTCMIECTFTKEETAELVKKCRANKCSVTGALMAASSLAFVKLLQKNPTKFVPVTRGVAVSLRTEFERNIPSDYLGSYISAIPFFTDEISALTEEHLSSEFWKLSRRCTEIIRTRYSERRYMNNLRESSFAKHLNQAYKNIHKKTPGPGYGYCVPDFYLSNIGRHEIDPREVRKYKFAGTFWHTAGHAKGPTFRHFMMTANGQLYWCLSYYNQITKEQIARRYLDEIFNIIKTA